MQLLLIPRWLAASQGSAAAGRPVFYAYFIAEKAALQRRPGPLHQNGWLQRRLKPQRGADKDKDLAGMMQDRRHAPVDPATGIPLAEENVTICDVDLERRSRACHVADIATVPPGRHFRYITCPMREENGVLQPVTVHRQVAFHGKPCLCPDTAKCGGLR